MRILGKKTTRAKESLLSSLGMIRSSSGMAPRPAMARQQSAWVERPLEEVEEGEEEEEEKDTRHKYKRQTTCHPRHPGHNAATPASDQLSSTRPVASSWCRLADGPNVH